MSTLHRKRHNLFMYKNFFLKKHDSEGRTLGWTVASGILYSVTSLVFLMVVSHRLGDFWSNIYSIGMMIALQILTVGRFSVRNFQVSDVEDKYSFKEYLSFRIITCFLAVIVAAVWIPLGGYRGSTAVVIGAFCVYRIAESFSDLFEGLYQQKHRLDISGKSQFTKNVVMLIIFSALVLTTGNLVLSSVVLAALSVLLLFIVDGPIVKEFATWGFDFSIKKMWGLCRGCFSLFVSSFVYIYINNSPKYAIESLEGEDGVGVAKFSMLFMPTFVIELLAGFTLRTWLLKMASCRKDKDYRGLRKLILKQMGVILVITVLAMVGIYFLGGWALSLIYGTDLHGYEFINVLLMLSGGLGAVYALFENVVTIYRKQQFSIIINVVAAVTAFVLVTVLTSRYYMLGATIGFVAANLVRTLGYIILAIICMFTPD